MIAFHERFRIRRAGLGQQFLAEIHPVKAEKGPVTTVTAKPITAGVLPGNHRHTVLNVRFTPQIRATHSRSGRVRAINPIAEMRR
ncbi:hypothetical protein M1D96_03220 [Pseudomonas sp. D1-3]|uniref:hypothetical protein n=1 Tax=Phytopseudomonas argentinensis TaxID=289370 RepID=UPI0011145BB0|nr:hypothetical protein [Pseudomonas argentinensis]